jgi:hypothetical protein
MSATVGRMAALGCDLLQLILGQVGEVSGVGGSHCCSCLFVSIGKVEKVVTVCYG